MRDAAVVLVPFEAPRSAIRAAEHFRSTWILSSIQSLRTLGHFDRYLSLLPKEHHTDLLYCVAGTWIPLKLAHVHYEACDALALSTDERVAIGRAASERAQHSVLATMVKLAKGSGADMWTMQKQLGRLWRRTVDYGDTQVLQLGPKEGRVEFVGCSLFGLSHFRHGMRGVLTALAGMFAKAVYVHDVTPRAAHGSEGWYCFQWA